MWSILRKLRLEHWAVLFVATCTTFEHGVNAALLYYHYGYRPRHILAKPAEKA